MTDFYQSTAAHCGPILEADFKINAKFEVSNMEACAELRALDPVLNDPIRCQPLVYEEMSTLLNHQLPIALERKDE